MCRVYSVHFAAYCCHCNTLCSLNIRHTYYSILLAYSKESHQCVCLQKLFISLDSVLTIDPWLFNNICTKNALRDPSQQQGKSHVTSSYHCLLVFRSDTNLCEPTVLYSIGPAGSKVEKTQPNHHECQH